MTSTPYFPLLGKSTLPELRRAANPAYRLTEGMATVEAMLWSMEPDRRAVLRALNKCERDKGDRLRPCPLLQ